MSKNDNNIVSKTGYLPILASAAVAGLMTLMLWMQGRIWWCNSGDLAIYVHEAWNSRHTSQHLLDPYTFTHILHGVLFFWITGLIFSRINIKWRFFVAIVAESVWEVFENSSYVIAKYRSNTASLDYFGDSIMNAAGDVLACAAGFWIAYKLGWRLAIVFFIFVEACLLLWIRDSLLLNILMLIYPLDVVKAWQIAA